MEYEPTQPFHFLISHECNDNELWYASYEHETHFSNNFHDALIVVKNQNRWRTLKLLDGLNCESKGEDSERRRSWGTLPSSLYFGGKKVC
jgi:hypothetical protein